MLEDKTVTRSHNPFNIFFKQKLRQNRHKIPALVMKETAQLWNQMSPNEKAQFKNTARTQQAASSQMMYTFDERQLGQTGRRQLNFFKAAVDDYMARMIVNNIDASDE